MGRRLAVDAGFVESFQDLLLVDAGFVESFQDLLLVGRETRPLADAMAFTARPFIEGVTWNHKACLEILKLCNIPLKNGSRWRVPAELRKRFYFKITSRARSR